MGLSIEEDIKGFESLIMSETCKWIQWFTKEQVNLITAAAKALQNTGIDRHLKMRCAPGVICFRCSSCDDGWVNVYVDKDTLPYELIEELSRAIDMHVHQLIPIAHNANCCSGT